MFICLLPLIVLLVIILVGIVDPELMSGFIGGGSILQRPHGKTYYLGSSEAKDVIEGTDYRPQGGRKPYVRKPWHEAGGARYYVETMSLVKEGDSMVQQDGDMMDLSQVGELEDTTFVADVLTNDGHIGIMGSHTSRHPPTVYQQRLGEDLASRYPDRDPSKRANALDDSLPSNSGNSAEQFVSGTSPDYLTVYDRRMMKDPLGRSVGDINIISHGPVRDQVAMNRVKGQRDMWYDYNRIPHGPTPEATEMMTAELKYRLGEEHRVLASDRLIFPKLHDEYGYVLKGGGQEPSNIKPEEGEADNAHATAKAENYAVERMGQRERMNNEPYGDDTPPKEGYTDLVSQAKQEYADAAKGAILREGYGDITGCAEGSDARCPVAHEMFVEGFGKQRSRRDWNEKDYPRIDVNNVNREELFPQMPKRPDMPRGTMGELWGSFT